ncbi:MAG: putative acetyltransferase [Ilumatobacter sp.]|jgi:predicted acetyltransferase
MVETALMAALAYTYHSATEDDYDEMCSFDGRAFGEAWKPEGQAAMQEMIDFERFMLVRSGSELVGVSGCFSQELTIPGGAQIAAGGVTWVAVAPTHRRRGLLTEMMNRLHVQSAERGEPLAILTASEGGIYDRFGYGVATHWRVLRIDRRQAQLRDEFVPVHPIDGGAEIRLSDMTDTSLPDIYDRYRRQRVGEIRRTAAYFDLQRVNRGTGVVTAIHPDGYACWKIEPKWNAGHPAHELELFDLIAVTREAHAALWHTILSVDLIGPINGYNSFAVDDALPYLLDNPRAARTTNLNDMLWIRIDDVRRALESRTYGTEDALVIELTDVDGGARWKVEGSPTGATVKKVRSKPDVVTDRASLGALYLGGVRASTLAAGQRLVARNADVLRRADHFFAADRMPHCATGF